VSPGPSVGATGEHGAEVILVTTAVPLDATP